MTVATLDKRVNLRIDEETYDAYEKVASFFNRTVPDFMREALKGGLPTMHNLGAMIDRAKAGDKDAVQELFDSLLAMHEATITNARVNMAAEMKTAAEEGADSNSNTVR
jgi:hypothetical protein